MSDYDEEEDVEEEVPADPLGVCIILSAFMLGTYIACRPTQEKGMLRGVGTALELLCCPTKTNTQACTTRVSARVTVRTTGPMVTLMRVGILHTPRL